MTTTTTASPYFAAKAAAVIIKAGGDPALSGPLAAWAQDQRAAGPDRQVGVLVASDGRLLAATRRTDYDPICATASYVTEMLDTSDDRVVGREVGLAAGQLRYTTGLGVIHVTTSDVCLGAGRP